MHMAKGLVVAVIYTSFGRYVVQMPVFVLVVCAVVTSRFDRHPVELLLLLHSRDNKRVPAARS